MLKEIQLENPVNRIVRFRKQKFNTIFACLISFLAIYLFSMFYQNENLFISILVYALITFFILRQLIDIGISFRNDINHSIDFSLSSKGWELKHEQNESLQENKTVYSNRTNLKWVNNVEITVITNKERTKVFCNTYSIKDVISIFHFFDEQKLLNDLIGGEDF